MSGKCFYSGQFICGNRKCDVNVELGSYEVCSLVFSILLMQQYLKSSFSYFVLLYIYNLNISFPGELFLCRSRGAETSTCEVGSLQEVSYSILLLSEPSFY
jgi:hypothetical protein